MLYYVIEYQFMNSLEEYDVSIPRIGKYFKQVIDKSRRRGELPVHAVLHPR
jgi:hypothetical protein